MLLFAGVRHPAASSYCVFVMIISRFCAVLADDIYREGEGSGENILKVTAWVAGAAAQGTIIALSVKSCIEIMQ